MFFKMNHNPSVLTKLHCGILIMSVTITSLLIIMYLRITYIKKLRKSNILSFDDDDAEVYNIYYDENSDAIYSEAAEKNIKYTKEYVKYINNAQVIYNQDSFGKVKSTTFVIVIQVHDNIIYLKELVESLKFTMGITNSLLIFSHDYYNDEINGFIQNIRFAKYTQIFYPYSTQLFPSAFPGNDPSFCTNDFECDKSLKRVESHAQKKHFWWWQTNYVFEHLRATEEFDGTVVFLEEDQYVLKDFIFMLKVMESTMQTSYPYCEIIVLGANAPSYKQFHVTDANLTVSPWDSISYDMGIGFNRNVWNTIKEYSHHFCHFQDYRWQASLKFLGSIRPQGKFVVLSSDGPRVIRYKNCVDCLLDKNMDEVRHFAKSIHRGLFPRRVNINISDVINFNVSPAGGWDDVRDLELCMYFVKT